MPTPTNALAVVPINLPVPLVNPAPAKTMVLQHGKLTIKVTSNQPSLDAVESFRSALYQRIMRLIDPSWIT